MPRTVVPTPGKFEWIGRGRSAWCTKAELSGRRRRKGPFLGPNLAEATVSGLYTGAPLAIQKGNSGMQAGTRS